MSQSDYATLRKNLEQSLEVMYKLDMTRLEDMTRLAPTAKELLKPLALVLVVAEKDIRPKLSNIRYPGEWKAKAWWRAWMTTRPIRLALAGLRASGGELVKYHVALDTEFITPATEAANRRRRTKADKTQFDILGGA